MNDLQSNIYGSSKINIYNLQDKIRNTIVRDVGIKMYLDTFLTFRSVIRGNIYPTFSNIKINIKL